MTQPQPDARIGFTRSREAETRRLAAALREAVRRHPGDPASRQALAKALLELGEFEEVIGTTRGDRGNIAIGVLRIAAMLKLGKVEEALAEAEGLHNVAPRDPQAGRALLDALRAAGRREDRMRAARTMAWVAASPRYRLTLIAGEVERDAASPEALLAACDDVLAGAPAHTLATYYRGVALAMLGRDAQARAIMDFDHLVSVTALPVPQGYCDAAEFHQALAGEICANTTLMADPTLNSTADGRQTQRLLSSGDIALPALLSAIETAVQHYAARLDGGERAFASAIPARAHLRAWAVVCGSEGRQRPHLHPGGWLSGSFYVAAPCHDGTHRGDLAIGPVGTLYDGEPPWGVRRIEPVPGRLVLFPSYVPHATLPSGVPGDRIVVAFDVVPEEKH